MMLSIALLALKMSQRITFPTDDTNKITKLMSFYQMITLGFKVDYSSLEKENNGFDL